MEHHSTLPPSSFPALQLCPHFMGHGEGNESSRRGDRVHEGTEILLRTGKEKNHPLAPDEAEAARWMAFRTKEILTSVEGISERIEILDFDTGEVITFGTLDVWGYGPDEIPVVIDWKTGMVDDYSAQVAVYALGLMDKLGVDACHCYILYGDQQKHSYDKVARYYAEQLFRDTLINVNNKGAAYVQNKYCARCAIRPVCPAWNEPAAEALAVVGMELEFREGLDIIVKDADKLGRFIKGWKSMAKLVEDHDVTGKAIDFLEHGTPVGNYEVRERKGRRTYAKDSVQTLLQLIKDGDLDLDRAAAMFTLDPNEVDKFFKETRKPCPVNTFVKGTFKILVEKNGK